MLKRDSHFKEYECFRESNREICSKNTLNVLSHRVGSLQLEDQKLLEGVADQVDVEKAYVAAAASQSSSSADERAAASSSNNNCEMGVGMETLAFVAGYVAHKCRAIDPSLGSRACDTAPSNLPDRWLRVVSRGELTVPSERLSWRHMRCCSPW